MLPFTFTESASVWQRLRKALRDGHFQWLAGLLALLLFWYLFIRLPRPPAPGIVATYQGGKVTAEELRRYLHEYLPRCSKHLRCARHGQDHETCTDDEPCETFTDCDREHSQAHSPAVYRQAAASLVVDRLISDLVTKRKLAQKKKVRHLMKHATEEINLSDLHRDWHEGGIRVGESEVKQYYEQNRGEFGPRALSEVAEDIRALLTEQKEKTFVRNYLEELRNNSGLRINYELLKYPEPDGEQLRAVFYEKRDQLRLPARVELLLAEIPAANSQKAQEAARQARNLLLGQATVSDVRDSLGEKAPDAAVTEQRWISEEEVLWQKMQLARMVPGEVTDVVTGGDKLLVARVERRETPRPQRFEEVREQLAEQTAKELRQRHLNENRNATLFTIHGEPYSLGDFIEEFQELTPFEQARYSTFDGREKLLERMVECALVVEDASDDLRTAKNRKRIDRVRLAVLKQVLHQEEVDDRIAVTDEELREFFEKHRRYYRQPTRVKISAIRVAAGHAAGEETRARQEAEKALAELEAIPSEQLDDDRFAQVAKQYSDDPAVVETGGKIDEWVSESGNLLNEMFRHEFHRNVLALKRGELSPVFRMGDDFCVVLAREREESRDRTLDEVRELVREDLTEIKHRELTSKMEVELVGKAQAKIYDFTLLEMLRQESRESDGSTKAQ